MDVCTQEEKSRAVVHTDPYTSMDFVKVQAGTSSGTSRVMRGGAWRRFPASCRLAYRFPLSPGDRHTAVGFRLCLSL